MMGVPLLRSPVAEPKLLCEVSDPTPEPTVTVEKWAVGPGVYIDEHGQ